MIFWSMLMGDTLTSLAAPLPRSDGTVGAVPEAADSVEVVFPRALRIGSIGGVDIRIDPSWLLIAALVALQFWAWFSQKYAHGVGPAVLLALLATGLFFASVLAHELGHALEAIHRDVHVAGVTLFVFGGVTETRFEARRPRDEFALSAVGPYVSFVLAALFGLIATGATYLGMTATAQVSGLLGWLNLALAVFNLVPGAPLDGGRVLRSLVWAISGDRERAVRFAGRAGQFFGLVLVAGAAYAVVVVRPAPVFTALLLGFIGWFLFRAAQGELGRTETLELLRDRSVRTLLDDPTPALRADATVVDVLEDLTRSTVDAHPVIERNGQLVGVLRVDDAAAVPRSERAHQPVRAVMCPLEDVATVDADASVAEALDRIEGSPVVVVVDDGALVALASQRGLQDAIERVRRLHGRGSGVERSPRTRSGRRGGR